MARYCQARSLHRQALRRRRAQQRQQAEKA
jgi:hypothetical protein